MARKNRKGTIVVVGLGRFGQALAEELYREGRDVLGIDMDEQVVRSCADILTYAEVADATDESTLLSLGVADASHAVVGIGDSLQASILATATLSDIDVPDIWAKALTTQHQRILKRVGAHRIVFPEGDAGRRVAHRIASSVYDYIEIDEGFVMAEVVVPDRYVGQSVAAASIPQDHRVMVVCNRPPGSTFSLTTAHTHFVKGDLLLVAGTVNDVQTFADYTAADAAH